MSECICIIGEGPLHWEVKDFLEDHHVEIVSIDQPLDGVTAVIDLELEPINKKTNLLEIIKKIPLDTPIFTSILHQTATEIASWVELPTNIVGFSPLMLGKLRVMEFAPPLQVNEINLWKNHLRFWKALGKEIEIIDDQVGLIFPRIISTIINEASYALAQKIASKEDIDTAMKKGTSFPYGPFEWCDELGIDQVIAILNGLYRELGDSAYSPAPLLRKMAYAKKAFYV